MIKRILYFAIFGFSFMFLMASCNKKDKDVIDEITVYGSVVESITGLPVQNAKISIYKDYVSPEQQKDDMEKGGIAGLVGSTVTGSDGYYEFTLNNLDRQFLYVIEAEKSNVGNSYMDVSFSNIKTGGKLKCDFLL